MKIHLLHGIHTAYNNPTVPGLVPWLEKTGIQVMHPDYGYVLAAETRRVNPMVIGLLKPYIETGDVLVGHSNGCAIIYDLLGELIATSVKVRGVVFINGALSERIELPSAVEWCDVYFNEGDTITQVAQIAEFFGTAPRCWGEMGHVGYLGPDVRITNFDCGNTPAMPKVNGHSDLFAPANLPAWGDYIGTRIAGRLTEGGSK